jgi:hypothetical protein
MLRKLLRLDEKGAEKLWEQSLLLLLLWWLPVWRYEVSAKIKRTAKGAAEAAAAVKAAIETGLGRFGQTGDENRCGVQMICFRN